MSFYCGVLGTLASAFSMKLKTNATAFRPVGTRWGGPSSLFPPSLCSVGCGSAPQISGKPVQTQRLKGGACTVEQLKRGERGEGGLRGQGWRRTGAASQAERSPCRRGPGWPPCSASRRSEWPAAATPDLSPVRAAPRSSARVGKARVSQARCTTSRVVCDCVCGSRVGQVGDDGVWIPWVGGRRAPGFEFGAPVFLTRLPQTASSVGIAERGHLGAGLGGKDLKSQTGVLKGTCRLFSGRRAGGKEAGVGSSELLRLPCRLRSVGAK